MKVLVTGGAGFVGANVCVSLAARHPDWDIVALDSLRRRGSELNLVRLREAGIRFVHGDVRERADIAAVGEVQCLIEASAEPSVLAGLDGGLDHLVGTNLVGAFNCLEVCRRHHAQLVFLSTSRVYPVSALCELAYDEGNTRFELDETQAVVGASSAGIAEDFPLLGARTFYGATKLAAELLVMEYAEAFGLKVVVNRCGLIAGPGQFGKVDQGVVAFWLLAHHFGHPLRYLGFGGSGKQVRDVLHVDDLVDLLDEQLREPERWHAAVFNVGGGRDFSLSLLELTTLCREASGREVPVQPDQNGRPGDVPIYVSDCARLFSHTDWRPRRGPSVVLQDTARWVAANESMLEHALA
jgi:CDP-paratose 2-epimerase